MTLAYFQQKTDWLSPKVKRRVPLEGEELKEYLESQKQAKEETTKSRYVC